MRRKLFWFLVIGLLGMLDGIGLIHPDAAWAIPAWERKYGIECSGCHYPVYPRLNATGQRFRWAGYRMPNEFGKEPDVSNVGHFLAARGTGQFVYDNPENANRTSAFQWDSTTLFFAGAVTEHLSAFNEIEREAANDIGLVAQIQGTFGNPDHFTTVRFGQFHSIYEVGVSGFDRPTGITPPSLFTEPLTTSGVPYQIALDQRGVEVAHVYRNSRLLAQILNGIDSTGSGTEGENDQDKDLLVAFEQMIDDLASGFTLYGYRGVWHDGVAPDAFRYYRYGASANKIFPFGFEALGGYIHSNDDRPSALGRSVQGDSFFAEVQQRFGRVNGAALARYDWIDPDRNTGRDVRSKETLGAVYPFEEHLRLSLEGSRSKDQETNLTDYQLVAQAMIVF